MSIKKIGSAFLAVAALVVLAFGAAEASSSGMSPCEYNEQAGLLGTCSSERACDYACDNSPYNGQGGVCNPDNCCVCY